jgi:predicted amidohydrolase
MTAERLREVAEPEDGMYVNRARNLARELGVSLVLGLSERRGDKFFNTSFFIDTGGSIVGRYSKSHLNPKTEALYSPGTEYPVFSTEFGKLGMLICFDRQPPEPARILGVRGAQLVLVPGYSRKVGEVDEILLLRVRAYENGYPIAWVSPHNVMMIDRDGKVLVEDRSREERIIYATFDLSAPAPERDAIALRHPERYQPLVEEREGTPR